MKHVLPEEQLIEYAKSYLKAKGFKKKNKRWTKDTGEFTLCFYIQGSSYSKEDYYIRPGIFINALMPCDDFYGHFMLEIEPSTPEEVVSKFDDWCEEWTNKSLIKERLLAFMEWAERSRLNGTVSFSCIKKVRSSSLLPEDLPCRTSPLDSASLPA